jgi:hypothetical protein
MVQSTPSTVRLGCRRCAGTGLTKWASRRTRSPRCQDRSFRRIDWEGATLYPSRGVGRTFARFDETTDEATTRTSPPTIPPTETAEIVTR